MFPHILTYPAVTPEGYRAHRRRTLNFEAVGGEVVHGADLATRRRARRTTSRRFRVTSQHKERTMAPNQRSSRAAMESFRHHRDESFEFTGAISVQVTTRSGDVTVRAGEAGRAAVRLGTNRSKESLALTRARVEFDASRGTLVVETTPRAGRGLTLTDWFDRGGDVDVVLVLPEGSDVQVTTVSGDTLLDAPLGDVAVSSVSGDLTSVHEMASLDARSASGDISAGAVRDRLRCKVASGDVTVARVAARTDVASASGDVRVTVGAPGDLSVNVASGDVLVRVLEGVGIDVTGRTVSGHLDSRIDLSGLDDADGSDQLSTIKVMTVSGDILIDRVAR